MEAHIKEDISSSAEAAALQFSADELNRIQSEEDMHTPLFRSLVDRIDAINSATPYAEYSYIMRRTKDPMQLAFIIENDMLYSDEQLDTDNDGIVDEDEATVVPGELFDISEVPAMQKDAWEGVSSDAEITHDKWGSWISGYAPIRDSSGKAVAIIGIDIDAMEFLALSQRVFPQQAFAVFILIALCIIAYIFYLVWKRQFDSKQREELVKYSDALEDAVKERTKDLENATSKLEKKVDVGSQELVEKIEELETINKLMVGRELKMEELKNEIRRLKGDTSSE